ncbi:endonuclease/exonuclease/phosphatase family protein [Actinoplanes sp. NPDC024001]|uniref:endonuclease/exonuclease/phosphatase family protein n=1 Tax=Actinoplanes sp. NPDC024001 TaxID=3154598 RepID=UPI0033EDA06C
MRRVLPSLLAAVAVSAVLAGVLGHAGGTGTAPAVVNEAAAAGEQIRAVTWNICGEAGSAFPDPGYCPHRNNPDAKVGAIRSLVDAHQLNVVMLQEMCSGPLVINQSAGNTSLLDRIQANLGSEWTTAWAEMPRPDGRSDCRSGLAGTLGVAIAVRGTISQTTRRVLHVPQTPRSPEGQGQPSVLCAKVKNWSTEVCTTHLYNSGVGEAAYAAQIKALRAFLTRPVDAPQVVIGGDFNTRQWDTWLKTMHDDYPECDEVSYRAGDAKRETTIGGTDPGKIDYLFASAGFDSCDVRHAGFQDTLTSATPDGFSDHAPLIGYTLPLS